MLKQTEIQQLMRMRGFGYSELDISIKLRISRKTVSNHLLRLKALSLIMFESGMKLDDVYFSLYFDNTEIDTKIFTRLIKE